MKKEITYYFDMDGCLAEFRKGVPIEETFKPGYFFGLAPERRLVNTVIAMAHDGYDVRILSSVYETGTAAADKHAWLKKHGLGHIPAVFVPYGKDKNDYVADSKFPVLVDDYTYNLDKWTRAGHLGFKYYNGINGTKGTWKGYSVDRRMSMPEIMTALIAVAEAEYEKGVRA